MEEIPGFSILQNSIQALVSPSQEEWSLALPVLKKQTYPKNASLVKAGENSGYMYFILEGITRHFYAETGKGNSATVWFSYQGDWVNDAYGFSTQQPALTSIIAVTEVEAFYLSRADQEMLFASSPIWERLGRLGAEGYLVKQMLHTWSLYFRSAKERFHALLKERPELFKHCPLIHIASFLNITPETLSRLRSEMKDGM
ncbi:MAG: Crp/Fnr family transcriptional regulator [Chitinophagaceae bacterium]|nr:Crp/Fnr family transcriptional regulator [Chitinophagaceae bacterium]